jgi:predicted PurR-regulated permease PerM
VSLSNQARASLQIVLIVLAVATGAWALYRLAHLVLLLILATLFAYLIAPLVQLAEHPVRIAGTEHRLSRGLAIGVVYVFILGCGYSGSSILVPRLTQQIGDVVSQAPAYAKSLRTWEQQWMRYYKRSELPVEIREGIDQAVLGLSDSAVEGARGSLIALVGLLGYMPWLVLIPILAFFFLKGELDFRRAALHVLAHRLRLRGHRLLEDLDATLAAYIRAQLLACLLVGILCGVGFAMLGVPYALLLGVLAGIMEFVPLLGPLMLTVVATVIAALHAPILALWACGFIALVRVVEDYVIYPRLIGRGIHLHPLAVILAVLAGVELGGIVGVFLAVPFVAISSVAGRHWLAWSESTDK